MKHRLALLAGLALVTTAVTSTAGVPTSTKALRDAVTVAAMRAHQRELQKIAQANGGTRAAGTGGYEQSVAYVVRKLTRAGYQPVLQDFSFALWSEISAAMSQVSPSQVTYVNGTDFQLFEYSGSGVVTAASVTPAGGIVLPPTPTPSSASGCAASDFAGFPAGHVALIQRGTCTFAQKVTNAQAAGASAAIIFNEGNPGRTGLIGGTLGGANFSIPAIDVPFALGEAFYQTATSSTGLELSIDVLTQVETVTTSNVVAETAEGRSDRVVVVGAHLDSVPDGPGIHDNGSGSAAILEIAIQMKKLGITPVNKVRFAWWGAEEEGLIGSEYYVSQLTARDVKDIALNLNFDMIASPNFARFVYDGDGDGTGTAGPNGSATIEDVFTDYLGSVGLFNEPTAFDGRSDYGPFIDVGIPAGGLFTGAEGIKTARQAAVYGGTAGEAYDSCYHLPCDDYANNNEQVFEEMGDAAAHAVLSFAMTGSAVNGTDKGKAKGLFKGEAEYWGARRQR